MRDSTNRHSLAWNHRTLAACAAVGIVATWSSLCTAQGLRAPVVRGDTEAGVQRALLIGVEKYRRAPPLRFITNDVKQLSWTLRYRGSYQVAEIVDGASLAMVPTADVLRRELPDWLDRAAPQDDVLVYFSGHGFRAADGGLYLAAIDCDPAQPAAQGIPVDWLRKKLQGCKARFKLLVLDVCHAGCEKGDSAATPVPARDLALKFEDLTGVVTLASCQEDQQSLIWDEKNQSLFSYWLNQGLRGHADNSANGSVSIDELYDYLYKNVTEVARRRFARQQTPVRIVRTGTAGVPTVVTLRPRTLKEVLDDVAEQLATMMQLRKVTQVGVLEFTSDTSLGELLGADFGVLGRYCAEELASRLAHKSGDRYSVVDRRTLQQALAAKGFAVSDLASPKLKDLAVETGGMQVVVQGILRSRVGRVVTLQCKLLQTQDRKELGGAGDTAELNESEWAMLGLSAAVPPTAAIPDPPHQRQPPTSSTQAVFAAMEQQARRPHPMLDSTFPYRVKIMVNNRERPAVIHGNQMCVPLSMGEVYEIWVENRTQLPVFMRLLVDGLNTLPEKVRTKAVYVEPADTAAAGEYQPAQRVNLSEARAWQIDPKDASQVAVRGFFSRTGEGGSYTQFKVVDAPDSLAGRQHFTDQLGLITAAFYSAKGSQRGAGTGAGERRQEDTGEYEKAEVGNLLGVVHIRYAPPNAIDAVPEP